MITSLLGWRRDDITFFGALNAQLVLRNKIQTCSVFSEIRMTRIQGEWMSGYCKTGAQANKPHFHKMVMRHTPRGWPFTSHFSEHMASSEGGVAMSWLLVKRAKDAILRPISSSVWNELSDCSHRRCPHLAFSGLSTFFLFRGRRIDVRLQKRLNASISGSRAVWLGQLFSRYSN